jgi:ABC-type sugar transport system ATPase subunit
MIYVSHRLPEVMELCDRISVLRDGAYVGTLARQDASRDAVVRLMIGRSLTETSPAYLSATPGAVRLRVQDLASPVRFEKVTFAVRAGEIVGLAGLVGAGRSEVAQAIFGLDRRATGTVELDGEPIRLGRVRETLRRGIGLVPEDRKRQGLIPLLSCQANFSLVILDQLRRWGLLDRAREGREARALFERLRVKTSALSAAVATLSGGNQQKVVMAKWLARPLKVLIVDEPTRGVDVGAKATLHQLLDDLARQGLAILLISSELPEVLSLSARIVVMRAGRIAGELPREQASQESLMRLMAGAGP